VEADALAGLICDYRKTRLSHLSEAGPKELREAVRATSAKSVVNGNLSDPNLVNNHFASIATDHLYNPQDVLQYYAVQQDVNQDFHTVFTARCYASAVLAMGLCLSVSVSVCVCHKSEFY